MLPAQAMAPHPDVPLPAAAALGGRAARPDVRASLPRVDRQRPKGGPVRKSRLSKWRAGSLIAVHVLVLGHVLWWLSSGRTLTPLEPSARQSRRSRASEGLS